MENVRVHAHEQRRVMSSTPVVSGTVSIAEAADARNTAAIGHTIRARYHDRHRIFRVNAAKMCVEKQGRLNGSLAVYSHGECPATTPALLDAPLVRTRDGWQSAKPGAHHPWKRGVPQPGDTITGQLE